MRPEDVEREDVETYRLAASQWPDPRSEEAIKAGLAAAFREDRVRYLLGISEAIEALGRNAKRGEKELCQRFKDFVVKLAANEMRRES